MPFDIEIIDESKISQKKEKGSPTIPSEISGESYYDHEIISYFNFDDVPPFGASGSSLQGYLSFPL